MDYSPRTSKLDYSIGGFCSEQSAIDALKSERLRLKADTSVRLRQIDREIRARQARIKRINAVLIADEMSDLAQPD